MSNSKKKIILITGASRGFGFQAALKLAKKGVHLIITARTLGALEDLSDKVLAAGSTVTVAPLDLCREKDFQIVARTIYEKFGGIDILVHSASSAIPMTPIETIQKNEIVNFFNNTIITQRVIQMIDPLLKKNANCLALFIQDNNRYRNKKFLGIYNATRTASREIIAAYAAERKRLSPTVLTFDPKPMPTKIRATLFPGEDKVKLSSCEIEAEKMVKFISSFL
ncbi:MAG: SDR family NAD(P)-dependent oxidoreductase [Paracoccaceae bacterium]